MRRLLVALLPARDREAVLGDLREEFGTVRGSTLRTLLALAVIVARRQPEPYRDAGRRRGAAALVAIAVGLAWAVHAAAWPDSGPPPGYDPASRLVLEFWAAPHLTSALAAVLLVVAPSTATGGLAATLCVAAAEFGAAARP